MTYCTVLCRVTFSSFWLTRLTCPFFKNISWQILHSAFGKTAAIEVETYVEEKNKKQTCLVYQKTGGSRTVEPLRKHAPIAWWTWKWDWMEFIQNETRDWKWISNTAKGPHRSAHIYSYQDMRERGWKKQQAIQRTLLRQCDFYKLWIHFCGDGTWTFCTL